MFKNCLFNVKNATSPPETTEHGKIIIPVIDVLFVGVRVHLHPLTDGPPPHHVTISHTLAIPVSLCLCVGNILVAQEVTEWDIGDKRSITAMYISSKTGGQDEKHVSSTMKSVEIQGGDNIQTHYSVSPTVSASLSLLSPP